LLSGMPPAGRPGITLLMTMLTVAPIRFSLPRLAGALAALVLLGTIAWPARSAGDVQAQIAAGRSAAASLRNQIAAESAVIDRTAGGLATAQARLDRLSAALAAREQALHRTQLSLLRARDRLVALENRLQAASLALAANLRAGYEHSRPDLMSVILAAHGFSDLLEQVSFLQRIGHEDAAIIATTRTARQQVRRQAVALAALERRDQSLTRQVLGERTQVAALHDALLRRQIAQLDARSGTAARLGTLTARLHGLEAQAAAEAAAQARAAAAAANGGPTASSGGPAPAGLAVDTGGMVQAPAGAPAAVAQVIAAGNAIATLPYVWGGGHGSFHASGYDCSGSVSYALAAAGLLSSPLDSTGFESWGDAGPGHWITVYANAGHAFMVVAGWRFDTVALSEGGTRWSRSMADTSGFVARHPPGL
jgi:cell wall-associated NlpC family hydrolase